MRISQNTANEGIRGKRLSICISHALDYRPALQLRKLHALYCQMWVKIWFGMLDGWNTKIKVYAACFLLWREFKSWSTFPPIVNLISSMVQDMLQWGRKQESLRMQLIVIDIEPVHGSLLKFLQCKCKLSMKNPCGSNILLL